VDVWIINKPELDMRHLSINVKCKHLRNKKDVRMKQSVLRIHLMTVLKSATYGHDSSQLIKYTS
jgi:hypothetical protein